MAFIFGVSIYQIHEITTVWRNPALNKNTTSNKPQFTGLPERSDVSKPSTHHKNTSHHLKNTFHTKAPDFKTTVQEFFAFSRQKTKQLNTNEKQTGQGSRDSNPFYNDQREMKDNELFPKPQKGNKYGNIHKKLVIEDDHISSTESENSPDTMKDKWTLIKIITGDKATKYILNDTNKFSPITTAGIRKAALETTDNYGKGMGIKEGNSMNIHQDHSPKYSTKGYQNRNRRKKGKMRSTQRTLNSGQSFPKVRNIMEAFGAYQNASFWKEKGHKQKAETSKSNYHDVTKFAITPHKSRWHSGSNSSTTAKKLEGTYGKLILPWKQKYLTSGPRDGLSNHFDPGKAADDFVQTIHSPDEKTPFSNEVFIGSEHEDDIVHSKSLLTKGQKWMRNHKIKWLPPLTAASPMTTKDQSMNTKLETVLRHNKFGPGDKMFTHVTKEGYMLPKNDVYIPKRIRNIIRGTLQRVYTPRDVIKGNNKKPNFHSILPLKSQSFATGQFQTAVEHISLLDEADRNTFITTIISTTTSTFPTTTSEPRSTRKPETITISGLFPDTGDIWQTIGKNPKPILFTPSVTTKRHPNKFKIKSKATDIKSISWATAEPLQELVVHSENDNSPDGSSKATSLDSVGDTDDKISLEGSAHESKMKNNETWGIMKRMGDQLETNGKDMVSQKKKEYEKLLRKFEADLKKKNLLQEKDSDNFLLSTTPVANIYEEKKLNTQTTTLTPQKTAITQAKIKHSSNKDIMWGKCCLIKA